MHQIHNIMSNSRVSKKIKETDEHERNCENENEKNAARFRKLHFLSVENFSRLRYDECGRINVMIWKHEKLIQISPPTSVYRQRAGEVIETSKYYLFLHLLKAFVRWNRWWKFR